MASCRASIVFFGPSKLGAKQRSHPADHYLDRGVDARKRSFGGASSATAKLRFQLLELSAHSWTVGAIPQVTS